MKLFVGLGNPGGKYENTRHNIGFFALDAIADAHGFPAARSKFQGALSEGRLGTQRVMLLKPMTFMNLSGQSVGEALRYFKLAPDEVWVFHDELDLAPGKVRVKTGGGHAGHNGLRSLHEHIGEAYHRVRIGIGHPGDKRLVSGFVLHDFAKADRDWIDPLLKGIADGAQTLAAGDGAGFMNKVALARPKSEPKPEPKSELKSEPKAGAKPTPKPTPKPIPKPKADAEPSANVKPARSGQVGPGAVEKPAEPAADGWRGALRNLAERFSKKA